MTIIARLVAVALVAAAASLAVPSPAAYAAPCTGDSGVSVVVDFNGLGGGVQQVCVSGGGGDAASSLFPAAGFPLSYASRQPGFVCRVKGVPTSDPCVNTAPADAFWGLWWSDGDASSWTFSSLGAASLSIPDGGMVAFSWDAESGTAPPSASPSHPDPAPTPEPEPAAAERRRRLRTRPAGRARRLDPAGLHPVAPAPTAARRRPRAPRTARRARGTRGTGDKGKQKKPKATPGATPTSPATTDTEVAADEGTAVADPPADSDGLPGWVAPALIGVLFAAAGVVLLVRRRRSGL